MKHTVKAVLMAAAAAITLGSGVGAAQASIVTFAGSDFVDQNGTPRDVFQMTITEASPTGVVIDVSVSTLVNDGDILLIGLEGNGVGSIEFDDVDINTSSVTTSLTAVCYDQQTCGTGGGGFNGNAFNSGGAFESQFGFFDTILRFGVAGASGGNLNAINFTLAVTGLAPSDFAAVGFRIQNSTLNGSLQIYKLADMPPPNPVPLPAAGWLLLAGVGGLAAWGRRRKMAA